MNLIEREIARQDWQSMRCGCGDTAEHLAGDLRQLAGRGPEQRPVHVSLEEHVWSPATLWEPAPAVTSVALAALADELAPLARGWFLELLQRMVAGEHTERAEHCQAIAAQGIWLLYEEVMSRRSPADAGDAFEILTVIEPDRARLQRVREIAAEWLPVCCRTGLCDDEFEAPGRA
ncbi:hypothetical protein [Streptomyces sp. NPDC090025]|uniref:hypothetical protein n=1 Tax=Streptomyces sp. NPDC090025 TaxID=3365922 RepID=UPI0038326A0C